MLRTLSLGQADIPHKVEDARAHGYIRMTVETGIGRKETRRSHFSNRPSQTTLRHIVTL